jgi:hypothetical protein
MHNRMKKLALPIVAYTPQGFADCISFFIDYWEPFFGIDIFHNETKLEKLTLHQKPLCRFTASPPRERKNSKKNRFFPPFRGN